MSPPSDISTFILNASQKSWPIIISSCLLECNIAPGLHVLGIWNCTLQLSIDKPFHQGSKTLFSILSSTGYFSNRCYFCLFSPKGISRSTHLSTVQSPCLSFLLLSYKWFFSLHPHGICTLRHPQPLLEGSSTIQIPWLLCPSLWSSSFNVHYILFPQICWPQEANLFLLNLASKVSHQEILPKWVLDGDDSDTYVLTSPFNPFEQI